MTTVEWDQRVEVHCLHAEECGACPLIGRRYDEQCREKLGRLERAFGRYGLRPVLPVSEVIGAQPIAGYRRRAKLVVFRAVRPAADPSGTETVSVGLYRRNDNHGVVDIPGCQVLSPLLADIVAKLRAWARQPPDDLAVLLTPASDDGTGVLSGIDVRELRPPGEEIPAVLLTLVLVAERARPLEELRGAARALRQLVPALAGVAVTLRPQSRQAPATEHVPLSGASEVKDALAEGHQLVSHGSFLQVHRGQAQRLYEIVAAIVSEAAGGAPGRVLDLYGGTGAIALSLAHRGHHVTLVESYAAAVDLVSRAAQSQRLDVEAVTGDVASVTKALGAAATTFDVAIANPPRRGLSPAAREALAALRPKRLVYVACDLDNLSRDLDHLARLGMRLRQTVPLDMLPLTEEIEAVAALEPAPLPCPVTLYEDDEILALDKPPHEPLADQPEYPTSLVGRARPHLAGGEWLPVLKIEAGTSGVCIVAKTAAAAARWTAAVNEGGRLVYLAAARGVTPSKGAISRELRGPDGPKMARTRYRRLAIGGGHSILRVVPERRHVHQIRRHLAAIGHPVLGDARYGHAPTNRYFEEKHGLDRSFLHLVRVEIEHPTTHARLLIEAPLPPDLRVALVHASDESVLRFLENKRALGGGGPDSLSPASERSPLSTTLEGDEAPESITEGTPSVDGLRSIRIVELDDAPRTIRGELLTPDDD